LFLVAQLYKQLVTGMLGWSQRIWATGTRF